MIAIDDQNDWTGCLGGHPQARTPHIDHLASRGVLFRNAHCQSPLCNPSRTSLLTGRRPSSSGVYGLAPDVAHASSLQDTVTLPRFFRSNGYHTSMAGKIFHGNYGRRSEDGEFDVIGPPRGSWAAPCSATSQDSVRTSAGRLGYLPASRRGQGRLEAGHMDHRAAAAALQEAVFHFYRVLFASRPLLLS